MKQSQDFNHFTYDTELVCEFSDYYQDDLRPHQRDALDFMNERNKGIIQAFCGTGKSRIIYEKVLQIESGNVLLVFPSLPLVSQFFNQYFAQNDDDQIQATICDSKHTKTVKDDHFLSELNIHLTTYNSLAKYKDYFNILDLVIFDEAHHIATSRIISLIQQIESADIFYFTATPKIAKKLLNMYESEEIEEETKSVIEPLNPIDCGEIFKYDFQQALQDEFIVDYELHHCIYQPTEDIINDQFKAIIEFSQIHKRTRVIAFNQYVDKQSDKKTNSSSFAIFGTEQVQIRVISAKTSPKQRDEIFKWFQQEDYEVTKILFNSQCIKEGIDLPCTDLVVFCDDKQSPINIVQCIGRATRLSSNKQSAMITAMIPFDQEQTQFKVVTNICKALKNVDFRMKSMFDNNKIENFIQTTIIGETQFNSMQLKQFKDRLIVELGLRCGDLHWIQKYDELKLFLASNNYQYPNPRKNDQKVIGLWVEVQRRNKRVNILSDQRISLLNELQDWKWDHDLLDQWMFQYNKLNQFLQQNERYPTEHTGLQLSRWIGKQKKSKTNRKYGIMDEYRINLLEKLPNWKWEIDLNDNWMQQFNLLKTYLSQNKNEYPMPSQGSYQTKLHRWVSSNKRSKFGNGTYKQCEERFKLLETLPNWKWQENPEQEWLDKYNKLTQFIQQFNKYPSSTAQLEEEHQLGVWICRQRIAKKENSRGLMNEYRIKMLEKLPNWRWESDNDPKWINQYNILKIFVASHNRYPKANISEENKICIWVGVQKRAKKKNQKNLTSERIQMLEQLPNWKWECDDFELWISKYSQIKQFIKDNNRLPTSQTIGNERQLTSWKRKQLSKFIGKQTTSLSQIQINLLDELPGWKWSKGAIQQIPKQYTQSIIKETHQVAFTSNTSTLQTRFQSTPQELISYHEQRELKQKSKAPDSLPHNIIITKMKGLKNKSKVQVIDLGCGLNKIAEGLKDDSRFEFTSIDFQKLPNAYGNVVEGNIGDLAHIEEYSFRYAIMSLCFWGVDFERSIRECHRILEEDGCLYIIQTIKKMPGFESILQNIGFIKKGEQDIGKYQYIEYRK